MAKFLLSLFALLPLIADAAPDPRPVLIVVGMANEAKIAAGPGVQVVVSAGNANLLRERLKAFSRANVRAVLSFGVAGGLDPAAKAGDLYLPGRVVAKSGEWATDARLGKALVAAARNAGLDPRRSTDVGEDGISGATKAARAKLRQESGADIVDNESQVAAAFASREGLPFAVVRAVSDTANFDLPPAALLPLKPDGTPDGGAILKSIGQHPEQVPALIEAAAGEGKALVALRKVRKLVDLSRL